MKKITSILSLLLCVALMVSVFSGCGNKNTVKTGAKGNSDDISNYKNVNLVMYTACGGVEFEAALKVAGDRWNNDTGGKVTFINNGDWNTRYTKLTTLIATGQQVDAYESYYMDCPTLALKNIFLPVDDYLENTDYISVDLSKKGFGFRGKTYGMATTYSYQPCVIVYNKTMFDNSGEKTPLEHYKEGNWTWETFRQTAINMTRDINNDAVTEQYGFGTWLYHLFMSTAGLADYVDDNYALTISNSKFSKAAQFVQQCGFKDKSFVPDIYQWSDYFANSMLAMIGERPSQISVFRERGLTDELDFAPFPQDPDNTSDVKYAAWIEGVSILSNTVNAHATAKFIKNYWTPAMAERLKATLASSKVWNGYTKEQQALLDKITPNAYCLKSLGITNFESNSRGLWGRICILGESISSVIASMTPVLQADIDNALKDIKKVGTEDYTAISKIDFEKGLAPMVERSAGCTSLDGKAIAGKKSLTVTCPKMESGANPPVLVHTDPAAAKLPSGHTYKISVKYALDKKPSGDDTVYFQIRSLADIDNFDAGTADMLTLDSSSEKSGTLTGTINLPKNISVDDFCLVLSFTGNGGTVTIDEISIKE